MSEPLRALADDLRRAGVQDVRFDRKHRTLYSTDASIYQIEPLGVVIPRSIEEVVATVTVCRAHGVPVLPRGAGTSLSGQTVGHAVVVDTTRHLDQVVVDAAAGTVRCQPGAVLDNVNAALRPHGLMLGPDPSSGARATVGGTVGNNGTGAHSILYGMMADNVLAVQAVLADGQSFTFDEGFWQQPPAAAAPLADRLRSIATTYGDAIRHDLPRHWRRASGYNLDRLLPAPAGQPPRAPNPAQLLAGAEGTLAFITDVTLRAVPRPAHTVLAILPFDDLAVAAEATPGLLALQPSAIELLDKMLLDLCRHQPAYRQRLTFVEGDPACLLAVEFYAADAAEGEAKLARLQAHLAATGYRGPVGWLRAPAAQANVWAVRKAGLSLLLSRRGDLKPAGFMEDVAVPPEHLAIYVRGVQQLFRAYDRQAAFYGHASAGCLHIRPLLNLKSAADIALMDAMQGELLALIQPLGGVLSGEHGDGLKLTHLNQALFGARLTRAFTELKLAFDPANLFNPGKKVPEALLVAVQNDFDAAADSHQTDPAQLRYGPHYQTIPLCTQLDWAADGGLAGAVEVCNGSGDCRKASGVMCPSFQTTREEEHSTRGRANLLRAALAGQVDRAAWTGPARLDSPDWQAAYEALDLCLGCKACQTECPSSVDMAKIKVEVLAQRYAVTGKPLAARLFGHIHTLNRLAAPVAPLANAVLRSAPARRALGKLVHLHPARPLPSLAVRALPAWFAARPPQQPAPARTVALFPDTFITYNEPQIGMAAVEVLEAAGYAVELAQPVCCGRPLLSQGLVQEARQQARRALDALLPLAERGLPILVCEPSCAAMFTSDYADLLPDDPRVPRLAAQVALIDDWLAQQLAAGLRLPLRPATQPLLLHGHCHQKATGGVTGSLTALTALPAAEASLIDAGCCGMAGAFGYTTDHYALSLAIAGDRLAPAIAAAPDAVVCADGASCRQQIAHVTGRRALHVVEVLAQHLETV